MTKRQLIAELELARVANPGTLLLVELGGVVDVRLVMPGTAVRTTSLKLALTRYVGPVLATEEYVQFIAYFAEMPMRFQIWTVRGVTRQGLVFPSN